MKKLLYLLLLFLAPNIAFAESVEIDGLFYNLISKNKEAEVTSNPNKYSGDIVIPESVIYDGESFAVTSIGINAFYQCYGLTSVTIPGSVSIINDQAFESCRGLNSLIIPEGVSIIGPSAFWGCRHMKTITIPISMKEIGSQAFSYCDDLDIINISSIEAWCNIKFFDYPLYYNRRLFLNGEEIINLVLPDGLTTIPDFAFRGCSSFISVTLHDGIKKIGSNAFDSCSNIVTVNLSNSLDSICSAAFFDCKKLTSIDIPKKVHYLGNSVFVGCSSLESIVFPDSINIIADDMCRACGKLATITIPTNIQEIGYYAFKECPEIKDVYCYAIDVPQTGEDVFMNSFIESATLHVREQQIDLYKSIDPWKNFKNIVKLDLPQYTLTYYVDGEAYKSYNIEEGATIMPEADPYKEGYTFSGWSEIPVIMPANDVIVTGTFSINSYKLTYMIDDKIYKETMYEYGATITPEPQPEGDYTTFEWTDLPQTMPAHDVAVYASYTSGIIEVLMTTQRDIRIYSSNGKIQNKLQKGLNIVVQNDGSVKKVLIK